MRKLFLFFIVFIQCQNSNRNNIDSVSNNEYKFNKAILLDSVDGIIDCTFVSINNINSSLIKSYFRNGHLRASSYFLFDKLDGETISFSEMSKQSYVGKFKNGLKIGVHKYFYSNGKKNFEEYYENDSLLRVVSYDTTKSGNIE